MRFTTELEYLGIRSFRGKKDPLKTYSQISLLDGTDCLTVFVDDNIANKVNAKKYTRFQKLLCDFEITTGVSTRLTLLDVNAPFVEKK